MSIPISDIVKINPGVQSPGANALTLNSVILTKSTKISAGDLSAFTSKEHVRDVFGIDSVEEKMAKRYFSGYDNSTIKPTLLYFAPFNDTARAAWLRSGSWAGKSLSDIRALGSGTLIVTVNGAIFTSSTINLSTSGSFSDAASKITAGFTGGGAPVCTWEPGSSTFLISSPTTGATTSVSFATGTLSPGLLLSSSSGAYLSPGAGADSVSSVMDMIKSKSQNWVFFSTAWEPDLTAKKSFSEWASGQNSRYAYVCWDSSLKAIDSNDLLPVFASGVTQITYDTSAFGLALSTAQTCGAKLSGPAITGPGGFTVDLRMSSLGGTSEKVIASQPGCFKISKAAGGLLLSATYGSVTLTGTQALSSTEAHIRLSVSETGGTLFYNGTVVATSATGATAAGCTYGGELRVGYGTTILLDGWQGKIYDFAVYNTSLSSSAFTPSINPVTGSEANLIGYWALNGSLDDGIKGFGTVGLENEYDGVIAVYNNYDVASFLLGMMASIDFNRPNSRITAKFKKQSGLEPTVTEKSIADKLIANGYNFYGSYSENNLSENLFHDGQMVGKWKFIDLFANQVHLNAQLQGSVLNLLTTAPSIGYTQDDFSRIRSAMQGPINDAISFGSIRAGVSLSESQKAELNNAAGLDIATTIQNQGYYLQILDPGAQVRAARGSPIINFWYTDGGAVHKINVSSVDVI